MILRSALQDTISEVFAEHEVDDPSLAADMLDRLFQDFGEEIYDDSDEEDADEPSALGD